MTHSSFVKVIELHHIIVICFDMVKLFISDTFLIKMLIVIIGQ